MIAYSQATSKSKAKGPSPSRMLRLFALYENLTRFVMPLCSAVPGRPNPETPVDQSNNIVDISRVGLKQFWNLRSHMQDASQLATAHYPETLDRIFVSSLSLPTATTAAVRDEWFADNNQIIGAPSFFPTVWGWIKKWFDPITTSKIFILSQDQVKPTLLAFMDVSSIPKKYGGELDFECGMMPSLDPDLRKCLEMKDPKLEELFLTGPTRWVDSDEGEMVALSVGSIDGKPHKEAVATMSSLAVRTATNSSMFQSQRSHPNFSATQLASQPASQSTSAPQSRPQSKGTAIAHTQMQTPPSGSVQADFQQPLQAPPMQPSQQVPSSMDSSQQQMPIRAGPPQAAVAPESESTLPNGSIMKSQPASIDGPNDTPNGNVGPPKSITVPPPQLQRAETQFMTPATEPSELKNFQ